jgi:BirA family biotin operon repressor/biotin-[acetyl-CoA-carboxylase] ligase
VSERPDEPLDWAAIYVAAGGRLPGPLHLVNSVPSTMDIARSLAVLGAPDGTVVAADHQREGRGRSGRRWAAPPGSAVLLSVLRRPAIPVEQWPALTIDMAVIAVDVLRDIVPDAGLGLKWPNDLVTAAGDKVGGILAEASAASNDRPACAIVGLGINAGLAPTALAPGATSLAAHGARVTRNELIGRLLAALADGSVFRPGAVAAPAGTELVDRWRRRLVTLGCAVVFDLEGRSVSGTAEDVAADGALIVRLADGRQVRRYAGDIRSDVASA